MKKLFLLFFSLLFIPFVNADCIDYNDMVQNGSDLYLENLGYNFDYVTFNLEYGSGINEVQISYIGNDNKTYTKIKNWEITDGEHSLAITMDRSDPYGHYFRMYKDYEEFDYIQVPESPSVTEIILRNVETSIYSNFQLCDKYEEPEPICIPNWLIGEWSECINGTQTREIIDLNNCSEPTIETQECLPDIYGCMDEEALNYNENATIDDGSCIYPEPCESNWDCDDWSRCIQREKTRECIDLNECEEPTDVPETIKTCSSGGSSGGSSGSSYSTPIVEPEPVIEEPEEIEEEEEEITITEPVIEEKEDEPIPEVIVIEKTFMDKVKDFFLNIWYWIKEVFTK